MFFYIVLTPTKMKLELMFMKHYAPNRCLYIKVAKLRTGGGVQRCHTYKLQSQNIFKESTGGGGGGGGGGGVGLEGSGWM